MRWIVLVLLGLVLLVVAAFAIFLGPAHLQIRSIAPALPSEAELRALADVPNGPVSIRFVESSTQATPRGTLGHSIIVIQWANGRRFMIDAAMDRESSIEFGELIALMQSGVEPVQFNGTSADLIGDDVKRVEGVGFTHLHVDHVQGIDAFCTVRGRGARVYQTSWQAREHNLHTSESAERVAGSCLEPVALEGEGVLTTDDFPGLGIAGLGGHTPGSTLFAANVAGTLWLMSGDISNVKANLLSNTPKPFAYSTFIVPEDTQRAEELRKWLAHLDGRPNTEVVVAHDTVAIRASGLMPYEPGSD
ncbi:MAG: MBL fold metallo-hydrolase [bacterium]|nr:MBL fold metallo-hydrolase [bacterium]